NGKALLECICSLLSHRQIGIGAGLDFKQTILFPDTHCFAQCWESLLDSGQIVSCIVYSTESTQLKIRWNLIVLFFFIHGLADGYSHGDLLIFRTIRYDGFDNDFTAATRDDV